jgi:propanol-preferring alcohol dehydrogenase
VAARRLAMTGQTTVAPVLPATMLAMVLERPGRPDAPGRLTATRRAVPEPGPGQVLLRVQACAVCRTDLHIIDGELPPHQLPLVPGHEIVGTVVSAAQSTEGLRLGQRVGVPWLGGSCAHCRYCASGRENLCDHASFTGYDVDGGYAEYVLAEARYCLALPDGYDDVHVAPLLCAGLIGYRAYAMTGNAQRLGMYGFGAAAHILTPLAVSQGRTVYAFTRPGDLRSQQFALSLGAAWAGGSNELPPRPLDAAILFASDGALVPKALAACAKGGTVVCAGIHMSELPPMPYSLLWGERCVRSVANLTRADGQAFFTLAGQCHLPTSPQVFPLEQANAALDALRSGAFDGAAVLVPQVQP